MRQSRIRQHCVKMGCYGCGKIGVHLNKIYSTVNPNAFLCDSCYDRYVLSKNLNVGAEADRLLTLPVERVGACGHCGKEMRTVGPRGFPWAWCYECEQERERVMSA